MNFIIDFYKSLDTVNLFIFWGVIIVVLLLLTFSIIIAAKNKKLERIIETKGIDLNDYDNNELAIKDQRDLSNEIKEHIATEPINESTIEIPTEVYDQENQEVLEDNVSVEVPTQKFNADEYVMDYMNNSKNAPIVDKNPPKETVKTEENIIPTAPYQRNVLREMSLNQTSPIGIIRREIDNNKEINKANELNKVLNGENTNIKNEARLDERINISESNTTNRPTNLNNYLQDVSNKLSKAQERNGEYRTDYEIQQEHDAIISYQELLEKKDSIKTIDEEDAVISIEELIARKKEQEKIYNITKEEETDKFINELKDFRHNL